MRDCIDKESINVSLLLVSFSLSLIWTIQTRYRARMSAKGRGQTNSEKKLFSSDAENKLSASRERERTSSLSFVDIGRCIFVVKWKRRTLLMPLKKVKGIPNVKAWSELILTAVTSAQLTFWGFLPYVARNSLSEIDFLPFVKRCVASLTFEKFPVPSSDLKR